MSLLLLCERTGTDEWKSAWRVPISHLLWISSGQIVQYLNQIYLCGGGFCVDVSTDVTKGKKII